MRFVCDENVDAAVARKLNALGHEAWTIKEAGQSGIDDDDVTIYAMDHHAVVVTHDHEFSTRRKKLVLGRHIYLKCDALDAPDILVSHLDAILPVLQRHEVTVEVTRSQCRLSFGTE